MFETTFAATSGRSSAGPRSKRLTNIPRIPVIVEARIALLSVVGNGEIGRIVCRTGCLVASRHTSALVICRI